MLDRGSPICAYEGPDARPRLTNMCSPIYAYQGPDEIKQV